MHLAQVFKQSETDQCLLILLYRDLRDFEQKVKQKHGNFGDVLVHDLEQVAEFLGGDVDKIGLSDFFRLVPDPVFALDVVVLTHEL